MTANPVSSSDSFVKASDEETEFHIEGSAFVYELLNDKQKYEKLEMRTDNRSARFDKGKTL